MIETTIDDSYRGDVHWQVTSPEPGRINILLIKTREGRGISWTLPEEDALDFFSRGASYVKFEQKAPRKSIARSIWEKVSIRGQRPGA